MSATSPETLVRDVVQHLERHHDAICDARSAAAVLDVLSGCQAPKLMDEMHDELHGRLGIRMTNQAYEALLSGHAAAGDEVRVSELLAELRRLHQAPTAK